MPKTSAGLLMYRRAANGTVEVFLVHPGGPFWAKKDLGAWTIPKGEYLDDEEPLAAGCREFQEETGLVATGPFTELGAIKLSSGKRVTAWAFEGDGDPARVVSNTFELEWPKGSGRMKAFPEVDRAAWFSPEEARRRLLPAQVPLLEAFLALQR